jgi:flagellar hook-length control protein FliK
MEKRLMIQAVEVFGTMQSSITRGGGVFSAAEKGAKYASIYARIGGSLAELQPNAQTLADQVKEEHKNANRLSIYQLASDEMITPSKTLNKRTTKSRSSSGSAHGLRNSQEVAIGKTVSELRVTGDSKERQGENAKVPSSPNSDSKIRDPSLAIQKVKTNAEMQSVPVTSASSESKSRRTPPGTGQTVQKFSNPVQGLNSAKKIGLLTASPLKRAYVFRPAKQHIQAQVSRALAQVVSQGGGNTILKLNPHSLGIVRVDIQMKSGVATVKVRADNDMAQKLLSSEVKSLRMALERTGVIVESLQVEQTESLSQGSLYEQLESSRRPAMNSSKNMKEHRSTKGEKNMNKAMQVAADPLGSYQGETQAESQMCRRIGGEWHLDTLA